MASIPSGSSTISTEERTGTNKMYTFVALLLLAAANAEDKIIGGSAVTSTADAPWQVSLQQSGSHFCGGTVISPTHVMSAGHCKISGAVLRTTVAMGGIDYRNLAQQFSVSTWVQHPDFTQSSHINYDYSVITISGTIQMSAGVVEAAQLPASGQEFTGNAFISGWGKIGGNINILPTLTNTQCAAIWGRTRITAQSICVGEPESP